VTDLSHAQKAQREQEERLRKLDRRIETLQPFEERCRLMEAHAPQHDALVRDLRCQLNDAGKEIQRLQVENASTVVKLEAQESLIAEMRAYLTDLRSGQSAKQTRAQQ
jgi:hypothetical protein